jgi:hypothetical protein
MGTFITISAYQTQKGTLSSCWQLADTNRSFN